MHFASQLARKSICTVLVLAALVPMVGCVGFVANLLNVMGAGMMPAAFDGLEDKTVAVVCVSNSESFSPNSVSAPVAQQVAGLLASKVKDIRVVSEQRIDDWLDRNNWDNLDFVAVGKGVDADMVVAIDINSFSLQQGATMYKGRARTHVVVYDVASGSKIFSRSPPEIEFPTTTGIPATSISEHEFRKLFVNNISNRLARNFYAFDMREDVAVDTKTVSNF